MIKETIEASSILDLPIKEIHDSDVYILDREEFKRVYEYDDDYTYDDCIKGTMVVGPAPLPYKSPFIIILKKLDIHAQLFYFFHEYGHFACLKKDCYCIYEKREGERHAWETSLKMMLDYKCLPSLLRALRVLDSYKTHSKSTSFYRQLHDTVVSDNRMVIREIKKWINSCPTEQANILGVF